jgi:hypothetical protein
VNVPAAALEPPMVVPSMAPPLMSAVFVVNVTPLATVKALLAVINSELFVVSNFKYEFEPSLMSKAAAVLSVNVIPTRRAVCTDCV